MGVERFEDLIAWQKARALTNSVYQATRERGFAKDRRLSLQIQGAAVSIMSNIAEGSNEIVLQSFISSCLLRKARVLKFAPICMSHLMQVI